MGQHNVVGALLAQGDSCRNTTRSLPRSRPTTKETCRSYASNSSHQSRRGYRDAAYAESSRLMEELELLRKRCEVAEDRGLRNRRLLSFAQWGMHLLRTIFEELREN